MSAPTAVAPTPTPASNGHGLAPRLSAVSPPTITYQQLDEKCKHWLETRPHVSPAQFHKTRVELARRALCRLVDRMGTELSKNTTKISHIWKLFCFEYMLWRSVKEVSEDPSVLELGHRLTSVRNDFRTESIRDFCRNGVVLEGLLKGRAGILRWWMMIESDMQITSENLVAHILESTRSGHEVEESDAEDGDPLVPRSQEQTRARFAELPQRPASQAAPDQLPPRRDPTTGFLLNDSVRSAGGGQIDSQADDNYKSDAVGKKDRRSPSRGANSDAPALDADGNAGDATGSGPVPPKKKRGRPPKGTAPAEDGKHEKQDPWRLPAGVPFNLSFATTLSQFYVDHGWNPETKTLATPVELKHVTALRAFHGLVDQGVDFDRKCSQCAKHDWPCIYRNKATCLACFQKKAKCEKGTIPAAASTIGEDDAVNPYAPVWERRLNTLKRFRDEGIFTMPAAYYSIDGVPVPPKPKRPNAADAEKTHRNKPRAPTKKPVDRTHPRPATPEIPDFSGPMSPPPGADPRDNPALPRPGPASAPTHESAPPAGLKDGDNPVEGLPGSSGVPASPSRSALAPPPAPEESTTPSRTAPILARAGSPALASAGRASQVIGGDFKASESGDGAIDVDHGDAMDVEGPFMAAMDPPEDEPASLSGPEQAVALPYQPRVIPRSAAHADARREARGPESAMLDPGEVLKALAGLPSAMETIAGALREGHPSHSEQPDDAALHNAMRRALRDLLPNAVQEHILPSLGAAHDALRGDFKVHADDVVTSLDSAKSAFKEHDDKLGNVQTLVNDIRGAKEILQSHNRLMENLAEAVTHLAGGKAPSSSEVLSSAAPPAVSSSEGHPDTGSYVTTDGLDRAMQALEIRTRNGVKATLQNEMEQLVPKIVDEVVTLMKQRLWTPPAIVTDAKSQDVGRASLGPAVVSGVIGENAQEEHASPPASSPERLTEARLPGRIMASTTAPPKTSPMTASAGGPGECSGGDDSGASNMDVDNHDDASGRAASEPVSDDGISASEDEADTTKPSRTAATKRKRDDENGGDSEDDGDDGKACVKKTPRVRGPPRKKTHTEPSPAAIGKLRERKAVAR